MQAVDRQAIENYGIPGLQLMENAGRRCVEVIESLFAGRTGQRALIIAGRGNNGGDGFVIARLLQSSGWEVRTCVLSEKPLISGDAFVNLERLSTESVSFCTSEEQLKSACLDFIPKADLIVDAIFGTGLNSNLRGIQDLAVSMINASGRPVLSVDIPSGINASTGAVLGRAIQADYTVSFAFAKMGHILFPGACHTGRLIVTEIGIPEEIMQNTDGYEFIDQDLISHLLVPRQRQAHKGNFGHCLIIAASTGKTGAAALCANSAVRTGSGLVTVAVPASLNSILEIKTTEAMTMPLADTGDGHISAAAWSQIENLLVNKDVLAIGPGIGRHPETTAIVRRLVESADIPMVIDADGLNAVAIDTSILLRRKSGTVVLTPHPGEMGRLTGVAIPDDASGRIAVAEEFAAKFGVHLILKGARTVVASPDGTSCVNTSGNPGMASGGMGDVLTGIIASLLGQGYNAADACRIGVFIHGFSADLVADDKGETGINATDVIEKLPYAFKKLGDVVKRKVG